MMQEHKLENQKPRLSESKVGVKSKSSAPDVLVCIGNYVPESGPVNHAKMLAYAMGGKVILLHIIETSKLEKALLDPVEWDIQRRDAKSTLANIARQIKDGDDDIEIRLLEGKPVERICAAISEKPQDITTVFRQSGGSGWNEDDATRSVVECAIGSILMIPVQVKNRFREHYAKIIVPLDGSARGESALPKAARLAKAYDAELILCHAAPKPQPAAVAVHSAPKSLDLPRQAAATNRRFSKNYLNRIVARMADCGVRCSAIIVEAADTQRALLKTINDQKVDLVVMASHGQNGNTDIPMGDVAAFLMDHSAIPVLMVRQAGRSKTSHIFSHARSEGARPPSGSLQ